MLFLRIVARIIFQALQTRPTPNDTNSPHDRYTLDFLSTVMYSVAYSAVEYVLLYFLARPRLWDGPERASRLLQARLSLLTSVMRRCFCDLDSIPPKLFRSHAYPHAIFLLCRFSYTHL